MRRSMRMRRFLCAGICALSLCVLQYGHGAQVTDTGTRVVNLQTCLDASDIGKKELQRFDKLKKQFEERLGKKEKKLNELSPKFSQEYLDSISPEEEKKLKEEFQALSQDLSQEQSTFYQTMNQTQMEILQKMQDRVIKASKALGKEMNLRAVVRSDACLYFDDSMDITPKIIAYIDSHLDDEDKK